MQLGIVCGYGIIADARLTNYLQSVMQQARQHQLRALILSGGATVPQNPRTEAQVMRETIMALTPAFELIFEDRSITTLHNLLYAKQLIVDRRLPVTTVYIFCDAVRALKVACLAKLIFHGQIVHVVPCYRREPWWMYLLQIPFLPLQCLGAVCPACAAMLLVSRRVWMRGQARRRDLAPE